MYIPNLGDDPQDLLAKEAIRVGAYFVDTRRMLLSIWQKAEAFYTHTAEVPAIFPVSTDCACGDGVQITPVEAEVAWLCGCLGREMSVLISGTGIVGPQQLWYWRSLDREKLRALLSQEAISLPLLQSS